MSRTDSLGRQQHHQSASRPRPALFRCLLAAGAAVFAAVGWANPEASAQDRSIIQRGDAVVTSFAGTVPPVDPPADVHPLDRTFIDLQGLTAQIFDLANLGGGPAAQLADAPVKFRAKAADIGHVFGIAFEGDGVRQTPNIYLSASSMHGLQLVKQDGADMRRLLNGEPGATFMPGQFGPGRGGPGSIYRIDGRTGEIRLFANVQFEGRGNSAPGLGNLAYDSRTKQLFVTDLETGMIHRFTMDGRDRDTFDHGVTGRPKAGLAPIAYDPASRVEISSAGFNSEDTSTWGYAPKARMTFGLAVQNRRLYYSVAEGPQVWSVSIDADGDFGTDPRLEVNVDDTPSGQVITAIQFDGSGMMYLAQRGEFTGAYDYQLFAKPQSSVVLRYRWDDTARRWVDVPEEYAIGLAPEHRATVGGIALNYGYDRNGRINYGACRQTLWTTGEHLREGDDLKRVSTGGPRTVHGLQGNYKALVRPANEPPYESWFVDHDNRFEDAEINGHIGNVGIYNICEGAPRPEAELIPTVAPADPNFIIEKRCFPVGHGGRVRCLITVRNIGGSIASEDIIVIEDTRILNGPGVGQPVIIAEVRPDNAAWVCTPVGRAELSCRLPAAALAPGAFHTIEVWIDTRDLLIAGNYGFRNCAILRHTYGSGRACYEGGTEIIVQKTGPAVCLPGGLCRYGLTITNNGDVPYIGDLMLSDEMAIGGAPVVAPIVSIAPPLGCAPAEPVQVPFNCVAPVSLAPGESRTSWIDVQIPPGTEGLWIDNCFGATDPWLMSNTPLVGRLFKPVKAGPKVSTGFFSCVRTRIPQPVISSVVPPSIPLPPLGSGFIPRPDPVCWNGQYPTAGGRCACPGNTRWDPAAGECRRPPERSCYDPVRAMPNGQCCPFGTRFDRDNWVCRRPPQPGCYDTARRMPTGDCCPVGTRYFWETKSCRPPIVICENGERPLSNGLCGCPRGTRWDPYTRSCGKPGDQTGGVCPNGQPKSWGGRCPCPEGSIWNIATQSCNVRIVSCANGTVYNPQTRQCDPVIIVPPRCPQNAPIYNPQTKRCERAGGDQTLPCPQGQVRNRSGQCVPVYEQPPACPQGQVRTRGGLCIPIVVPPPTPCPLGQVRQINGQCAPVVTPPPPPLPCPQGQVKQANGTCAPITAPPPTPCPQGQVRQINGQCAPITTPPPTPLPCPQGQIRQINGQCAPITTPPPTPLPCPQGQVRQANGSCAPRTETSTPPPTPCPQGQVRQANGSCAPITATPQSCPPGQTRLINGRCVQSSTTPPACPQGQRRQPNGQCGTSGSSSQARCPTGQTRQGDACIPVVVVPTVPPVKTDPPVKLNPPPRVTAPVKGTTSTTKVQVPQRGSVPPQVPPPPRSTTTKVPEPAKTTTPPPKSTLPVTR